MTAVMEDAWRLYREWAMLYHPYRTAGPAWKEGLESLSVEPMVDADDHCVYYTNSTDPSDMSHHIVEYIWRKTRDSKRTTRYWTNCYRYDDASPFAVKTPMDYTIPPGPSYPLDVNEGPEDIYMWRVGRTWLQHMSI